MNTGTEPVHTNLGTTTKLNTCRVTPYYYSGGSNVLIHPSIYKYLTGGTNSDPGVKNFAGSQKKKKNGCH